jgi:hypothetical protein
MLLNNFSPFTINKITKSTGIIIGQKQAANHAIGAGIVLFLSV